MAENLPIWNAVGVEPPASLKTDGWQPGMKPSAQHMNWLFSRIYKCLEEFQAGGGTEELEQELADLQQALATHKAEKATLEKAGHVQLSNKIDGALETKAATEKAVKDAKEAAINYAREFGVGYAVKDISGADLNTLNKSGKYSGGGLINAPGPHGFFIEHYEYNDGFKRQIAYSLDAPVDNPSFTRLKVNGVWKPWDMFISESMKNVPGGYVGIGSDGTIPGKMVKIGEVNATGLNTVSFSGLDEYTELEFRYNQIFIQEPGAMWAPVFSINNNDIFSGTRFNGNTVTLFGTNNQLSTVPYSNPRGYAKGNVKLVKVVQAVVLESNGYAYGFASPSSFITFAMANTPTISKVSLTNSLNRVFDNGVVELWGMK
ncbi:pyocin knob domain-containing protein [Psychrobacillus sp.]|uniref:pyocin knob domain-containing protein n=1 Tax=Psychrobacillus sp. TaxID=1871623 RepID=UPI0028BF08FF|nr:pyocin knob domain-containing protein [Psychrobacillus sp.]